MAENGGKEIRISADSHVTEPFDLWQKGLPAKYRDQALTFPDLAMGKGNYIRTGGFDPKVALNDMAADGISAELLFPTGATKIYQQFYEKPVDVELAKAEERVYNDWVIEYCSENPDRLWGQAMIGLWDIDYAIAEMERTKAAGLKGVCTWLLAPPESIPFTSDHYERFWSACEEMSVPVSFHINVGFGAYVRRVGEDRYEALARRAYGHKSVAIKATTELIMSGVCERHPKLHFLLAEFECGWIPFFLEDLDVKLGSILDRSYYESTGLRQLPSAYFMQNFMADFLQDGTTGFLLQRWGQDNFCFSNDYPHLGGIWPYSDDVVELVLGDLPADVRRKVLGENIARHYFQPMPTPVERKPLAADVDPTQFQKPWLKNPKDFTFNKPEMGLSV